MRWSIVRLIWHREFRDQLRDRRTVFMIAVLFLRQGNKLRFPTIYLDSPEEADTLVIQAEDGATPPAPAAGPGTDDAQEMEAYLKQIDRRSLDGRLVDLLLVVPANFGAELEN